MSLNPVTVRGNSDLWVRVCEQLKWHNKGADRCIDTLNRLWRKHPKARTSAGEIILDVLVLSEPMLRVDLEQWSLAQMIALEPPHDRSQFKSYEPPVALHWFDQYFLLDGNTRVNFWATTENHGPHAMLVISEAK